MYIRDLLVEAKHGLHAHEKERTQRFKINVEIVYDATKAAQTDDIHDTINWSDLRQKIISVTQDNSFNLIETLADRIASAILLDKRTESVIVYVDKLDAFESGVPGIKIEKSRT